MCVLWLHVSVFPSPVWYNQLFMYDFLSTHKYINLKGEIETIFLIHFCSWMWHGAKSPIKKVKQKNAKIKNNTLTTKGDGSGYNDVSTTKHRIKETKDLPHVMTKINKVNGTWKMEPVQSLWWNGVDGFLKRHFVTNNNNFVNLNL